MSTKTETPTYVTFCQALIAECRAQGLQPVTAPTETGLPQNKGYAFLRFSDDGAALIVPKSATRMGSLDSHVDLSGTDGYIPLTKPNGKVACHFAPDVAKVAKVLARFVGASKRATVVASRPASQATPGNLTSAVDSQYGDLEVASWAASQRTPAGPSIEPSIEEMTDEELDAATASVRS